jgi:prenyltransferase beta subunit
MMNNLKKVTTASILGTIVVIAGLTIASVQVMVETRRDAVVAGISSLQFDDGSFACDPSAEKGFQGQAASTAEALLILNLLGRLDAIDFQSAINYLVQHTTYVETYYPYLVVKALSAVNALDRFNKTWLINFVMQRYNATSGAFFEPIRLNEVGAEVAYVYFPIAFPKASDRFAYLNDNMISTYLGVCILDALDAIGRINATKTCQWVLTCYFLNGGFKPSPNCYYRTTEFDVDLNSTGLVYTYCAVEILKLLGHLDSVNKTATRSYVLSCNSQGLFYSIPDNKGSMYGETGWDYNMYATKALADLESLNVSESEILNMKQKLLAYQSLKAGGWPIPVPSSSSAYGLFDDVGRDLALTSTFHATQILADIDLSLLDQLTSRALVCRDNIYLLIVVSFLVPVAVVFIAKTWNDFEKRAKELASKQASSTPTSSNDRENKNNDAPKSEFRFGRRGLI